MESLNVSISNRADDARKAYEKAEALYNADQCEESIAWYEKAVELGHVAAMNALGWSYLYGVGVETDLDKAAALFRKAMAQGNTKAAFNLSTMGLYFSYDMEADEVFRAAKMGAEAGMGSAFENLAYCYYYGKGCEENRKLAAYWACRCYEHRNECSEAYAIIARFYKEGYFFPKVPSMAKYCYLKLEEMDCDMSEELSAPEFRNIKPVAPIIPEFDDKDPEFFTQECPYAQYIEGLYYLGHGGKVPVDAQKAEELLSKAAKQGYTQAQYSLGIKYMSAQKQTEVRYDSDGIVLAFPTNNQLGHDLLRKAADSGDYHAINAMMELYFDHVGITQQEYWNYMRFQEMYFQGHDPFSYESIVADETTVQILKKIVDAIGANCLFDGDQVCAMFRELAPEHRRERRRVRLAYSSHAVDVLLKEYAVDEAVKRMVEYSDMSADIAKATVLAIYEVFTSTTKMFQKMKMCINRKDEDFAQKIAAMSKLRELFLCMPFEAFTNWETLQEMLSKEDETISKYLSWIDIWLDHGTDSYKYFMSYLKDAQTAKLAERGKDYDIHTDMWGRIRNHKAHEAVYFAMGFGCFDEALGVEELGYEHDLGYAEETLFTEQGVVRISGHKNTKGNYHGYCQILRGDGALQRCFFNDGEILARRIYYRNGISEDVKENSRIEVDTFAPRTIFEWYETQGVEADDMPVIMKGDGWAVRESIAERDTVEMLFHTVCKYSLQLEYRHYVEYPYDEGEWETEKVERIPDLNMAVLKDGKFFGVLFRTNGYAIAPLEAVQYSYWDMFVISVDEENSIGKYKFSLRKKKEKSSNI